MDSASGPPSPETVMLVGWLALAAAVLVAAGWPLLPRRWRVGVRWWWRRGR